MTKEGKDRKFMRRALQLALKGLGRTSPNPMVGSVVVSRTGKLLGTGFHEEAGEPHAEVLALKEAGKKARGATLYITLEPCAHFGRTPPCVDAVLKAGVKRVVIGTKDPNPLVAGKGIKKLRRAGVEVTLGVLSAQCESLNEGYNVFITTGLPLVILKLASTLDGRIATAAGESKWITGAKSRRYVHETRSKHDAVMVGSGTATKDDPRLNVRGVKGSVNPVKVLLDSKLKTPLGALLFSGSAKVIIYCSNKVSNKRQEVYQSAGVTIVPVAGTKEGLSLKRVLRDMARRGIVSVMIEGGATLAASFLRAKLVDKLMIFYAPKLLGSDAVAMIGELNVTRLNRAQELKEMKVRQVGEDLLVEGYLK